MKKIFNNIEVIKLEGTQDINLCDKYLIREVIIDIPSDSEIKKFMNNDFEATFDLINYITNRAIKIEVCKQFPELKYNQLSVLKYEDNSYSIDN